MSDIVQLWPLAAAWSAMIALSAIVMFRLPSGARLPMQWGPDGKPTWTAPGWLAVSFTPALALIVFALTLIAAGGTVSKVTTILSIQAALFAVVHIAHLYFAARSVAR
jgi:hypothetical protein